MDLRQTIKMSQQLVMTPQLQQAIKLLQMSRTELTETITEEMETNPALEEAMGKDGTSEESVAEGNEREKAKEDTTADVSTADVAESEINWDQYIDSYSASDYKVRNYDREALPSYENIVKNKDTLSDHLMWQLQVSNLTERERVVAEFMIGNVDDDGYLKVSIDEVVNTLSVEAEYAEDVLSVIQAFDPLGVASRDLKECLLAQANYLGLEDGLVVEIIQNHLLDIESRRLPVIVKKTKSSMAEVIAAVKVISSMEPRPGSSFADDTAQYITPDLYVHKVDGEFVITQNDEGIPKLRVSSYYKDVLEKGMDKGEAKEYVQDKVRSALWLIKSIQQRMRTIYKTMESILKFQKDFFDQGLESLKPLVLKDVADDIGMHESTISRVTNNKFVQTPQGIFELKFFFNSGISRYGGADIASESVKEKIRQLISAENIKKPLSDQSIVKLLEEGDVKIARRTVTKYREMLGIASSSKRKKLF
ncbi:MAG: RNA polymerase factor sigma-54 [Proteobacteria bacterium]|nr:RNA polymerase factor sigma-54 [Pseudomonadota bacterium]